LRERERERERGLIRFAKGEREIEGERERERERGLIRFAKCFAPWSAAAALLVS
jgi:hypothetical protein